MNKKALLSIFYVISNLLFFIVCYGQTDGDYRSAKTGNWSDAGTWETYKENAWTTATSSPSSLNGVIMLRSGHTVTVDQNISIDQVITESESFLIVGLPNSAQPIKLSIVDGTGTDLIVNGKVINQGAISNNAPGEENGTIRFNVNSIYEHKKNGGDVPIADWDPTSNCEITGYTNSGIGQLGQTFGNFIWDCKGQGNLGASWLISNISIAGDLTINNSGTGGISGGYLEIKQNEISIGGKLIINGGTLRVGVSSSQTLNVKGGITIDGGTLYFSTGDKIGTINVAGDFSFLSGLITTYGNSEGFITFNGTKSQKYTALTQITDEINFTVNSGATLQMADEGTYIRGKGYFKLSEGATLGVTSQYGINKLIPETKSKYGNILVEKERTYDLKANYIYNGIRVQETGNGITTSNNLIIDNAEGVSLSNNTIVNGKLTQVKGNINTGSNSLTVNGTHIAGTHTISGAGTYTLTQGATLKTAHSNGVSGTITTQNKDLSNKANFEFNSTSEQATGEAMPTSVKDLTINNPLRVNLSQNVSVSGALNLINGKLTTGSSNLITLEDGAIVEGAKNESFVNGPIKKVGDDAFTFPVGKVDKYIPIAISAPQNATDAFTAEYFPFGYSTLDKITSPGLLSVCNSEYWDLQRSEGNSIIDVTLKWDEDNKCSSFQFISDPGIITIAHFNGTEWNSHGGLGAGNAQSGSVTWDKVSAFSPFTFGKLSAEVPLPVHFSNVIASEKPNGIQIDFTNLTEVDISFYEVERSEDGISFSVVRKFTPLKNDNGSCSYSFVDVSAMKGKYIYRIKAVENTGKAVFSSLVSIETQSKSSCVNVYAKDGQVFLQGIGFPAGKYEFDIYSVAGQRIASDQFYHIGGSFRQTTNFNIAKTGVYIIKISGPLPMQKKFIMH